LFSCSGNNSLPHHAESAMPEHNTIVQFVKYALAGGLATATHIVVFHLLAWKCFPALQPKDHAVRLLRLGIRQINDYQRVRNSMISNATAFLVANMVAYITNILWVFERGRHAFLVEIVLFYLVSGVSMVLGTTLMGFMIKRFGMLTTYAFATNIVTAVMINYAVRKFFIFQG
jgi:putative flippase GtrA